MCKKERTVLHNLLYLFRRIPSRRKISHIRADLHPFIQIRHLFDTRPATCMPIVQHKRLSENIRFVHTRPAVSFTSKSGNGLPTHLSRVIVLLPATAIGFCVPEREIINSSSPPGTFSTGTRYFIA